MSCNDDFFFKQKEHSKIKSELVSKYLPAWAEIVWSNVREKGGDHLTYLDMFSGAGEYSDGTPATPKLVLDVIQDKSWLKDILQLKFYEGDQAHFQSLREVIYGHPITSKLKFEPVVELVSLDRNSALQLGNSTDVGTFTFIDPFGYKELSLELLQTVIRGWGSDCLFYFSVSGIERNIHDTSKSAQMISLFGEKGYTALLQPPTTSDSKYQLAAAAVAVMKRSLNIEMLEVGKRLYFREFCIEFDDKKRPSYYLIFLCKDQQGFKIMRDMMISRSLKDADKFPMFMHSEMRSTNPGQIEMDLSGASSALRDLANNLHKLFAGQTLKVEDLMSKCLFMGCPYQDSHIRKSLMFLYSQGKVNPVSYRKPGNFEKADLIEFVSVDK